VTSSRAGSIGATVAFASPTKCPGCWLCLCWPVLGWLPLILIHSLVARSGASFRSLRSLFNEGLDFLIEVFPRYAVYRSLIFIPHKRFT
jgi:hypothetical protein